MDFSFRSYVDFGYDTYVLFLAILRILRWSHILVGTFDCCYEWPQIWFVLHTSDKMHMLCDKWQVFDLTVFFSHTKIACISYLAMYVHTTVLPYWLECQPSTLEIAGSKAAQLFSISWLFSLLSCIYPCLSLSICLYLHASLCNFVQCSPQHIINSFAKLKKVPELVQYLHQVSWNHMCCSFTCKTQQPISTKEAELPWMYSNSQSTAYRASNLHTEPPRHLSRYTKQSN